MPSNVAVTEPRAGVVRHERYGEIPVTWQSSDVAARGVLGLEILRRVGGVERAGGLVEDPKVVAV